MSPTSCQTAPPRNRIQSNWLGYPSNFLFFRWFLVLHQGDARVTRGRNYKDVWVARSSAARVSREKAWFCRLPRIFPSIATGNLVPKAGFEPARPESLPPQDSVSTNSTTWAIHFDGLRRLIVLVARIPGYCRHILISRRLVRCSIHLRNVNLRGNSLFKQVWIHYWQAFGGTKPGLVFGENRQ